MAIYVRHYLQEPGDIEPTLTAVDEIDPRVNIWKRAAGALRNGGYIHPCGPYPRASAATVFFARHLAGRTEAIPEARVDVSIDEGIARVFVVRLEEPGYELDAIPVTGADNIVDLVLRIVAAASKRESTVGMKQAVLCEAEPSSIALTEPSIRDS
ncbi:hypothetical protein [Paraburkholderia sp. Clong3]|uniref:hypothetical protein n=1 Tax=Paraburkholderia sp. Clong3 TaxID=2991061 RepID=UPI003D1C18A3